jgi:hypothetical protein
MRVFQRRDQLRAARLRLRMVVQQLDVRGARQGRHAGLVFSTPTACASCGP